jgi:hypothetical protein
MGSADAILRAPKGDAFSPIAGTPMQSAMHESRRCTVKETVQVRISGTPYAYVKVTPQHLSSACRLSSARKSISLQ